MRKKPCTLLLVCLSALSLFAVDAVQTKRGDVFYGEVTYEGNNVNLTHHNEWMEQFSPSEVTVTKNFTSPVPIKPQKKGNFEIVMGKAIKGDIDLDSLRNAIRIALGVNMWSVVSEKPGAITAFYQKGGISLKLRICYGEEGYWYEYIESTGLGAVPSINRIQQNYFQLINQLERKLRSYY